MKVIKTAKFIAGAATVDRIPKLHLPEVAFAGKSNVGKSSLLNRLVGQRGLARVSKTPGRTQQINFFELNAAIVMVDLPGYGFARVPLAVKDAWRVLIESYLVGRSNLRGVVVIVDVRRGIEEEDARLVSFLGAHGIPAVIVATKLDKLKRSERNPLLKAIHDRAGSSRVVPFSAETGEGRPELWSVVDELTAR